MISHKTLVSMCIAALFAALLCICSPISIPIGPIPITLSVFAVMLCGIVLSWQYGLAAIAVFLALGLFLPVFSGGNTGLAALPGPTGGYIWSYLLMVPLIHLIASIPCSGRILPYLTAFLGCAASLVICYFCGTLQFSLLTGRSFQDSAAVCVLPFIRVDLLKAVCAAALGVPLRDLLRRVIPAQEFHSAQK